MSFLSPPPVDSALLEGEPGSLVSHESTDLAVRIEETVDDRTAARCVGADHDDGHIGQDSDDAEPD